MWTLKNSNTNQDFDCYRETFELGFMLPLLADIIISMSMSTLGNRINFEKAKYVFCATARKLQH